MNFLVYFLVALLCVMSLVPSKSHADTLSHKKVSVFLQEEFMAMRQHILDEDLQSLSARMEKLTHEQSIFLFEFTMTVPGYGALPTDRAYYQQRPFINLAQYGSHLDKDSFSMTYEIEEFQPGYGGQTAILVDNATAEGFFIEPLSSMPFKFNLDQTCRNTISYHEETYLKLDSVYCRMNISYASENLIPETEDTAALSEEQNTVQEESP